MKSAYELAMERLEKNGPQLKLTDAQREEIAELERKHKAKIAERELFLKGLIDKARATGDYAELASLSQQMTSELHRLNQDLETAKEKVRQATP